MFFNIDPSGLNHLITQNTKSGKNTFRQKNRFATFTRQVSNFFVEISEVFFSFCKKNLIGGSETEKDDVDVKSPCERKNLRQRLQRFPAR